MKIDSAPGGDSSNSTFSAKPDLMSTLRNNLGDAVQMPAKKGDDYDAFLAEMGDIL